MFFGGWGGVILFPTSFPVQSNSPLVTALSFIEQVKEASQGIWRWLLGLFLQMHINQWLCFQPSCHSEDIEARSSVLHE